MTERVSDDVLRRWTRTLTPGQAALCEELLELRGKVRQAGVLAGEWEARANDPANPDHRWCAGTRRCAAQLRVLLRCDDD